MKIVSGGQTGVDRAALDVCFELGIQCGGWCPKGRLAEGGTAYTIECCRKLGKPYLLIDMENPSDKSKLNTWMKRISPRIINIAGPRESLKPGSIYSQAKDYLMGVFSK